MNKMRRIAVAAAFLLCGASGAAFAVINNNPVFEGAGYTCNSTNGQCTCTGASDCYRMGDGHDCKAPPKCNADDTACSCDWQR